MTKSCWLTFQTTTFIQIPLVGNGPNFIPTGPISTVSVRLIMCEKTQLFVYTVNPMVSITLVGMKFRSVSITVCACAGWVG